MLGEVFHVYKVHCCNMNKEVGKVNLLPKEPATERVLAVTLFNGMSIHQISNQLSVLKVTWAEFCATGFMTVIVAL